MKMLVDQNISHRKLPLLSAALPDVYHVKDLGLHNSDDRSIFLYARNHSFDAILTLDDDFVRLISIFSAPPKVIWLRTGNCQTAALATTFIAKLELIKAFVNSDEFAVYELFKV